MLTDCYCKFKERNQVAAIYDRVIPPLLGVSFASLHPLWRGVTQGGWPLFCLCDFGVSFVATVAALHKSVRLSVRGELLLVPTRGPLYLIWKDAPQQDPDLTSHIFILHFGWSLCFYGLTRSNCPVRALRSCELLSLTCYSWTCHPLVTLVSHS